MAILERKLIQKARNNLIPIEWMLTLKALKPIAQWERRVKGNFTTRGTKFVHCMAMIN